MNTNPNPSYSSGNSATLAAKACIWSIRNQQRLMARLRTTMWAFSATILVLSISGRFGLQTALLIIGFGGLGVVVMLTGLIQTRRILLLNIQDPDLRRQAHVAMLELIDLKELIRNGRGFQKPNEPYSGRRVGCRNSND